jgi:hypothetical protein
VIVIRYLPGVDDKSLLASLASLAFSGSNGQRDAPEPSRLL